MGNPGRFCRASPTVSRFAAWGPREAIVAEGRRSSSPLTCPGSQRDPACGGVSPASLRWAPRSYIFIWSNPQKQMRYTNIDIEIKITEKRHTFSSTRA
jgi:hypothetical protein